MTAISVRAAREQLPQLLDRVEKGEELVITRRGKAVARMLPVPRKAQRLPPLATFRSSIGAEGTSSVRLIRAERDRR